MPLTSDIVSQFAKLTKNDNSTGSEKIVYGTITEYNGAKYVKLDGSDLLTPISSTANVANDERVTVMIKNHTATVTGNLSSPSVRTQDVSGAIGSAISEFEVVIADKVDTKELTAVEGRIDDLQADNVIIKKTLEANNASITNLEVTKLSAEDIEGKYANIDFSNIGEAAIETLYANSGLIKDVVIDNGTISGHLVGVTISGDLIEGNTIVAEKLVIKGDDGLYYKLNTDGMTTETEQTDYNSLNGSIIKAKSITATKISVSDLVAFDATIGGFNITDSSLYSGVKESVNNTTRGIYLDKTGQVAFGDATNFLKYYKASDGLYKLSISADEFVFSSNGKSVTQTVLDATGKYMTLTFAQSNAIEKERQSLTVTVQVWKNDEDVTAQLPKQAFTWQRESGNATADLEWNSLSTHKGVTEITISRAEIGKSCQIRCTLSEAGSYGSFKIEEGGIVLTKPAGFDDEFALESGDLYGEDYYYIEDGFVKRNGAGNEMYVTANVFDHSLVETSHITVKDEAIDIHSGGSMRISAGGAIDLKSGANMTVESNGAIDMKSGSSIKMESGSDITVKSGGKIDLQSGGAVDVESGGNVNVKSGANVNLQSGGAINVQSGGAVNVKSGANVNVDAGGNISLKTGGTFTAESKNFVIDKDGNVTVDGTVTAQAGKIGGWNIKPGALSSGSGNGHVSISTADPLYAIWAGAEASGSSPFRVERDGSVYLTQLYVTDENGNAQSTPVNLRNDYWKVNSAYSHAVKTLKVENNELIIELYNGDKVNFKKASSGMITLDQTWSEGRLVITTTTEGAYLNGETTALVSSTPANLEWGGTNNAVATFDITSDRGTVANDVKVDANSVYTAGRNSVTLSASGWQQTGIYTITASNGQVAKVKIPNVGLSEGSWDAERKKIITAHFGSATNLGSVTIDGSSVYEEGRESVTLWGSGWSPSGIYTITASNGQVANVKVPNVTLGSTSWNADYKANVIAYYGSSGTLGTITIDASGVHKEGYELGYTEGSQASQDTAYEDGKNDGYTKGYLAGWAAAKMMITMSDNIIKGPGAKIDTQDDLYTITVGASLGNITNIAANTFTVSGNAHAYVNNTPVKTVPINKSNTINVGQ